jgi:hypothetical protein
MDLILPLRSALLAIAVVTYALGFVFSSIAVSIREVKFVSYISCNGGEWTFLTNYAHVLLCVSREPDILLRDVAARVGITERATQQIVADLVREGYLIRTRVGRRNHYAVVPQRPFRHAVERDHAIGELLAVLTPVTGSAPGSAADAPRTAC